MESQGTAVTQMQVSHLLKKGPCASAGLTAAGTVLALGLHGFDLPRVHDSAAGVILLFVGCFSLVFPRLVDLDGRRSMFRSRRPVRGRRARSRYREETDQS